MDIEKTKRINELARELKDHGIAADYEEAYRQAEKMIESGIDSPNFQSSDISIREVKKEPPRYDKNVVLDALEIKNINNRLDALEQQLNVIFLKINEIIAEINKAEKKKAESPIEIRRIEEEKKAEKQKEIQASLKTQPSEAHPRTGDYKPEDVSIEKMFYYGGSRA